MQAMWFGKSKISRFVLQNSFKRTRPCFIPSLNLNLYWQKSIGKFFIMSTEFDKNISDWGYDSTDHKNGIDFFLRLVKWPKIDVKNPSNPSKKNSLKNINSGATFLFLSILCSVKIERLFVTKISKKFGFFQQLFLAILQVWWKN